jgi:hypothetical protein
MVETETSPNQHPEVDVALGCERSNRKEGEYEETVRVS